SFQQEEWEKRQTTFSVGKDIVHPYLKSKGITSITKLIITHGDHDHGGSALELLDLVDVKELVLGKKELFSELEQELVRETMKRGTPLTLVGSGDVWKEGEHTFNVLAPFGMEEDTNEQSIVIYTVFGNQRWLFTGDLGEEGEQKLIETFPALEVDVLKVGHHGSKTSTSTFFLEEIQPSYGLVSAGENNRYNHPHHEVLERLEQNHVKIFRTDKQGALIYCFSRKAGTFQTTLP
ncbi:MBL fold metallo-hydrolase, partial [Strepomyces sp. STD 3.1]|nr:MBL fold metallo-hydrolase [Streptomyces sp. STD 3.1]